MGFRAVGPAGSWAGVRTPARRGRMSHSLPVWAGPRREPRGGRGTPPLPFLTRSLAGLQGPGIGANCARVDGNNALSLRGSAHRSVCVLYCLCVRTVLTLVGYHTTTQGGTRD